MNKFYLTLYNFMPIILSIYILHKTFGSYILCDGQYLNELTIDLNLESGRYIDYTSKYNRSLEYLFASMDAGNNRGAIVFSRLTSYNRTLMIETFDRIRSIERGIRVINPNYISTVNIE